MVVFMALNQIARMVISRFFPCKSEYSISKNLFFFNKEKKLWKLELIVLFQLYVLRPIRMKFCIGAMIGLLLLPCSCSCLASALLSLYSYPAPTLLLLRS